MTLLKLLNLKMFGAMVGPNSLFDFLRDPEFTYESMKLSLPDYQNLETMLKPTKEDDEAPTGNFDLGELTASQLRNMNLEDDDEGH